MPDDEPGRRTAHRFTDTFLDVDTTTDWHTAAWRKLVMNAVVGTITVLTRTTNTVLLDRDARTLAVALADEVQQVAIADGAALEPATTGRSSTWWAMPAVTTGRR